LAISASGIEVTVDNRFVAGACALFVAFGVVGCSDPSPPIQPAAGNLPAGTAQVSVNGNSVGTTHDVSCTTTGPVTTIKTGDDETGSNSTVNSTEGLAVEFAQISDLGGFTGSYWSRLGPAAKVKMTGSTYEITGSAMGFNADNPSARATETFSIRVAC
jgi:lipoprotein LpqH